MIASYRRIFVIKESMPRPLAEVNIIINKHDWFYTKDKASING